MPASITRSGAFIIADQTKTHWLSGVDSSGDSARVGRIGFDANKSSTVYTDSGKVYPLSRKCKFIIKH